jgi:hypothetical protein
MTIRDCAKVAAEGRLSNAFGLFSLQGWQKTFGAICCKLVIISWDVAFISELLNPKFSLDTGKMHARE